MSKYTPAPWKALKAYEYFDESGEGTYFDPEEEDLKSSYVRIGSTKMTIVSNHDLFSFKNPSDAKLIALSPEMADTIKSVLYSLRTLKDDSSAIYELEQMVKKINEC